MTRDKNIPLLQRKTKTGKKLGFQQINFFFFPVKQRLANVAKSPEC